MPFKRLKILTWHVHGNYMYYLSQVPHDFYLVRDAVGSAQHTGRSGTLPWGDNVHDAWVEEIPSMAFDLLLFQSEHAYVHEQHTLLTPQQRRLPKIYLEHDPPQHHPTNSRHCVDDPQTLLVHVTPFNALMWDNGRTPTEVVEHGVKLLRPVTYSGQRECGLVVVNHLRKRGRRLGLDIYERTAREIPLSLVGMASELVRGGIGEVSQERLPALVAQHRFFFHPARYTSLGLAVIEAMMIGVPVVGLATTELATVICSGQNGIIDTQPERLVLSMKALLRDPKGAMALGKAGRQTALERFHIDRFITDWLEVFATVTA